ncbi:OLC1v1024480C1 [Oldenlandia corymbosa var. corymbosa]|uniref:OLC1v1024480C1 n=1 Tax=Oldenlandia corymbosa var. corymbosa TaxID=529605 RepID=A0AAV1C2U0_OLDCO|nr:OLC1v1024480C1 [Oldenlandia corymbosa var. corymbosa]
MSKVGRIFAQTCRKVQTLSRDDPTNSLKKRVAAMEKNRKTRDPRKIQFYVEVPESRSFLDTATIPVILTVVGTALFAKILMMVSRNDTEQDKECTTWSRDS